MNQRKSQESRDEKNRERGYRQERRISAQLEIAPMTARELSEKLHLSIDAIQIYMRRMRGSSPKRVYVCGHRPGGAHVKPAPIYALGNLPDVEMTKQPHQPKAKVDLAAIMRDAVLKKLAVPLTAKQLAAEMRISVSWARRQISMLRTPENRQLRIKTWISAPGKGDPAPAYIVGKGKDAPKPKFTRKDHYLRKLADPEWRARHEARQAANHVQRSCRKKPVTIFTVLGM